MPRIKSLITQVRFDEAKKRHKCQGDSRHQIRQGDSRMGVRNQRSWDNYCLACARKILDRDAAKIADHLRDVSTLDS